MNLKEVMGQKNFAVAGNTLNEDSYAYQIKNGLADKGYNVFAVGKELESFNEIRGDIDVIDLCINPVKGLKLIRECKKNFKTIVVQPGAGNDELYAYLDEHQIPYIDGCLLVGLSLYA